MDYNDIKQSSVIHWNYRGLTEFPIQKLSAEESEITDIYLKENLITRLPKDIGKLEYLESLYLSGNDLKELPKEIGNLTCLKCLDVSGNRIRFIPSEIGEVKNLKFLILDENELTELPLRIAELRCLRYLSVCDNKLKWLPQKPVYNYHHCEFRFWRNTNLKTLPYSLWYHMFKGQQTRSLNIGCLSLSNNQHTSTIQKRPNCKLKLSQDSKEWEYIVECPPQFQEIFEHGTSSPPSLFELSKRVFYQTLHDAAKSITTEPYSIYADKRYNNLTNNSNNNNHIIDLQENFIEFNIANENCDINSNLVKSQENNVKNRKIKTYYAPADIVEEHYYFLPSFVKYDIINGPVLRCENVSCKKPVFDYVYYEFCHGKLILIDNVDEVVLSAAFCSKSCADNWKIGKITIPWTLTS